MQVNGSCHCGQIIFEAKIDPEKTRICHCTDCQKLSGSSFRVVVPVPEADFDILAGEPKIYLKTAESGRIRQQAFCANCGTAIYATSNDEGPRIFGIRVGSLEQRSELIPKRQFWTSSALNWLQEISNITRFEKQ